MAEIVISPYYLYKFSCSEILFFKIKAIRLRLDVQSNFVRLSSAAQNYLGTAESELHDAAE